MVQTPSKFLGRNFLRAVIDRDGLSSGGKEYSLEESLDLYQQKEMQAAEREYFEMMEARAESIKSPLVHLAESLSVFTPSSFAQPKIHAREDHPKKSLSSDGASSPVTKNHCEPRAAAASISPTNAKTTQTPPGSAPGGKGRKMKQPRCILSGIKHTKPKPISRAEFEKEFNKSMAYLHSLIKPKKERVRK